MKHIDKIFRDKLYNQKATVPDGMWDKIAPALEEKSARSIIWFWFAGILTLLIGGLTYLLLSNPQASTFINSPLAAESPVQTTQPTTIMQSAELTDQPVTTGSVIIDPAKNTGPVSDNITKTEPRKINTPGKKTITSTPVVTSNVSDKTNPTKNLKSTSSNGTVINQKSESEKPSKLVITKSYISDNGSFIEKSDLSNDMKKSDPSYNVFINSEGLNAGALLRIIEPLENIPLPAFSNGLKKKINP